MGWILNKKDGVLIIEMRSNKANLHNPGFFDDFHQAFDQADKDHPAIPIILTASGRIFSAGIDFEYSFSLFERGDLHAVADWFQNYSKMMLRLFQIPRLTVAAINGHTFAGGMILALCCDFRIAAKGPSKFSINEVPVGVPMPSVYTEMIRFRLGDPIANETILSGETYDVEAALRLGFVKKIVEPNQLADEAIKQAKIISPECYTAYSHSKKMLQSPILERIHNQSKILEKETFEKLCSLDSINAQRAAFQRLKASAQ